MCFCCSIEPLGVTPAGLLRGTDFLALNVILLAPGGNTTPVAEEMQPNKLVD